AHAARDPQESIDAWLELLESIEPAPPRAVRRPLSVSIVAGGPESATRAQELTRTTQSVDVEVVQSDSRRAGLNRTAAAWVVFLDEQDTPDDDFIDALVDAQVASGADVVTAAVRPATEGTHVFLGDPGSLGLVANHYGVVGLVRSELAAAGNLSDEGEDRD